MLKPKTDSKMAIRKESQGFCKELVSFVKKMIKENKLERCHIQCFGHFPIEIWATKESITTLEKAQLLQEQLTGYKISLTRKDPRLLSEGELLTFEDFYYKVWIEMGKIIETGEKNV